LPSGHQTSQRRFNSAFYDRWLDYRAGCGQGVDHQHCRSFKTVPKLALASLLMGAAAIFAQDTVCVRGIIEHADEDVHVNKVPTSPWKQWRVERPPCRISRHLNDK
jgi:hypothetical protein